MHSEGDSVYFDDGLSIGLHYTMPGWYWTDGISSDGPYETAREAREAERAFYLEASKHPLSIEELENF